MPKETSKKTKRYMLRNQVNPGRVPSRISKKRLPVSEERAYSPLPELIIEPEPNRHDESEEFYKELERRMLRLYKKIFIDGDIDADISDISDDQSVLYQLDTHMDDKDDSRMGEAATDHSNAAIENFAEVNEQCSYGQEHKNVAAGADFVGLLDNSVDNDSSLQCHKLLTTPPKVLGDVGSVPQSPHVFENGSPILLPRHHLIRPTSTPEEEVTRLGDILTDRLNK